MSKLLKLTSSDGSDVVFNTGGIVSITKARENEDNVGAKIIDMNGIAWRVKETPSEVLRLFKVTSSGK